jgi:hypothetical protein
MLYPAIDWHEITFKIKYLRIKPNDLSFCFISANSRRLLVYSTSAEQHRTSDLTFNFWFIFCQLMLYLSGGDKWWFYSDISAKIAGAMSRRPKAVIAHPLLSAPISSAPASTKTRDTPPAAPQL